MLFETVVLDKDLPSEGQKGKRKKNPNPAYNKGTKNRDNKGASKNGLN